MYRTVQDFIDDWQHESASTLKVMKAMSDSSLQQKVSSEGRTLGALAWHIIHTLGEMGSKAGLNIDTPAEHAAPPISASVIADAYERASQLLLHHVQTQWNDSMLPEVLEMYGEKWSRGAVLYAIIKHEAHHRGQMTVLMRQAHLKVPGVYGPSKEEWAAFGMKAPE
ncbi:MAG TPA: DinB family protein [Bacteroidota bacterium]|nr:DinB family protein [Bacteroidota bacterium]